MRKSALLIFALAALSACATSTPYGPAAEGGGYGFSEQQIESDRYRVTFSGNSSTTRETVENFLLYRAAELTAERGFDYFTMLESDTEQKTTYSTTSYYPAFYGRYSYITDPRRAYYHFPYYAYGFGWGYPYDSYTREINRYTAIAFIKMHKGEKPKGDPHVFDAREVIENLRSYVLQRKG